MVLVSSSHLSKIIFPEKSRLESRKKRRKEERKEMLFFPLLAGESTLNKRHVCKVSR